MEDEPSEKEQSVVEEKEQDTLKTPVPPSSPKQTPTSPKKPGSKKGSKAGSKPGSSKSKKSGSAKSVSSSQAKGSDRATPKSRLSSAKQLSTFEERRKRAFKKPPPPVPDVLPDGVHPLFMASQSQGIFHCVTDENVTEEEPYFLIPKEDIVKDFFNRAAISDFHPFKQIIVDYPGDDILIVYDPDYKFGQNFLIATTEEAKNALIYPDGVAVSDEEGEGGEREKSPEKEVDTTVYQYVPPVSKPWETLGSEVEVIEESLIPQRKRVNMTVCRVRRNFGSPFAFTDRNVNNAKDGMVDCISYEDSGFALLKLELNMGTQAIPSFVDQSSQTDWRYPRNASTQYNARVFSSEEQDNICKEKELTEFVSASLPRFELAMQQNEIMNVFYDDWMGLSEEDSSFGNKADNHLKEYQSFTDLKFSKDKSITWVEWHPVFKGIVATALAERLSFDERIDEAQRVIMSPSLILIWSFTDPIHPQLLLEAPDDIYCFKFSPTDPNIVAGGCVNGQVVMWDITAHVDRLKTQRGGNKRKEVNTIPGFEDEHAHDTPVVRYCAVSSIEHSHLAAITDIQWLPDHFEINRMGVPQENKSGQCCQLMTAATDHPSLHWDLYRQKHHDEAAVRSRGGGPARADTSHDEALQRLAGSVLFWETRPPKASSLQPQPDKKKPSEVNNPLGVPTTFKHLDLSWKPMLKVNLPKSEPGGDHSPVRFSIQERQGDRSVLKIATEEKKDYSSSYGGKPGSGRRSLPSVKTHFYIGTEDGELVYANWMPQKDHDSGKIQTPKPDWYHSLHSGPVESLQRSPFFKDIILCVGGWTLSIWKEGISSGPLMYSAASAKRLTCSYWSPTRPAVFYIAKNDGTVDVWDLLDKTHEPSMTQNVTSASVTCIFPFKVTSKQHLLAVGDALGTLHILEIPWSLRQPTTNEVVGVTNYFDREVSRREFVESRWDFREKEKASIESDSKRNAGIAPQVELTIEEMDTRMAAEYAAFVEEENQFLRTLGLVQDTDDIPQLD